MQLRIFIGAGVGLLLAACQQQPSRIAFDRPKTTQQQMIVDRHDCIQKSMGFSAQGGNYGYGYSHYSSSTPNMGAYRNCMAAKGYTENNESGTLVVPPHLIVQMHN